MMKQGKGSIINISSFVVNNGVFGQANYVASKSAIEGMSKCWAKEFSRHGEEVRVNVVEPGVVLTDIFKNTPENSLEYLKNKTLFKRFADPKEVANVILFLASEESSYITGSVIKVDCGISIN